MILVLLLILFSLPINVSASSCYLTDFQVQNGTLLTPFNMQNNIYTIKLSEEANQVEYTYTLENSNDKIEVIDNKYDTNKENIMILKVWNEENKDSQTYTFYLEKEESIPTINLEDTSNTLNINKKERSPFLAPIIIFFCFATIGLLFYALILRFLKKDRMSKKSST